jgi:hypothetical protein
MACLNGAAALKGKVGDRLIVMAWCLLTPAVLQRFQPPDYRILTPSPPAFRVPHGDNFRPANYPFLTPRKQASESWTLFPESRQNQGVENG